MTSPPWPNPPPPFDPAKWRRSGSILLPIGGVRAAQIFDAVYGTGANPSKIPPGRWHTIDCSGWLPPDAVAVRLHTWGVITHAGTNDIADLMVAYNTTGEPATFPHAYCWQANPCLIGQGARDATALDVVLDDLQRFDVLIQYQGAVGPGGSTFAVNCCLCGIYLK